MSKEQQQAKNTASLGFEQKIWEAADTLRDTLLPKLMSGEIDVNEVKI